MKNFQIKSYIDLLAEAQKHTTNLTSTYNVISARKKLEVLQEKITEVIKPDAEIVEFEKEKNELLANAVMRDSNDQPFFVDDAKTQVKIDPEKKEKFLSELTNLESKYADAIAKRQAQIPDLNKFLDLEADVVIDSFKLTEFNSSLPHHVLEGLYNIITL